MSDDDQVTSSPTYFGREHEAVRHVVASEPSASKDDGSHDDVSGDDEERTDAETVVTTLGIVLTIPKES